MDKDGIFLRPRAHSASAVNRNKLEVPRVTKSKSKEPKPTKGSKMSTDKFSEIVRECIRVHDRAVTAIEAKELEILEVLKTKLQDNEKLMELEYFALSEAKIHEPCRDDFVDTKDKLMLVVAKINATISQSSRPAQPDAAISPNSSVGLKLPRFELSGFGGNPNDWLNFRDLFESSIIQNPKLTNIEKFQYLSASLKGPALQLIKGYPLSETNFDHAWQTLKERYDNKYRLASAQIDKLFSIKPTKAGSARSLLDLLDVCNESIRNLTSLGYYESNKFSNLMIVNILLGKLDENLRQLFMLSLANNEDPSYDKLIEYINKHAKSMNVTKEPYLKPDLHKSPKKTVVTNVAVPNQVPSCCMCKNEHLLCRCDTFLKLTVDKRWAFVKSQDLCFNCLRGHRVQTCNSTARCRHCHNKHHSLLHNTPPTHAKSSNQSTTPDNTNPKTFYHKPKPKSEVTGQPDGSSSEPNPADGSLKCFSSTNVSNSTFNILLSTASIKVKSLCGKIKLCRALIDNGSQRSLISKQCCQELGLVLRSSTHRICGINDMLAETSLSETSCQFSPHFSNQWTNLNALVVSKVTSDLPNFAISSKRWSHLNHFVLADPDYAQIKPVDILIGADLYSDLITGIPIPGVNGSPAAIDSKLGFLLCGKVSAKFCNAKPIVNCHVRVEIGQVLQQFWELESLPKTQILSNEDKLCEQLFESTVKRDHSGRYTVHLPFRENYMLGDTRAAALRRFYLLERRLAANPELKTEYVDFMTTYHDLDHMSKIADENPSNDGCYLPHHPVVKNDSSTTRVRVVFDASMRSTSKTRLNDCFLTGPRLQADLFKTLVRFRVFPVALSADIEKMYHQIRVTPEHCQFQKIFWRDSPRAELSEFSLSTVTYGFSCVPYLAIRPLQQLARDEKQNFPTASEVVLNHFYVDDLLSGTDSTSEAQILVQDLNSLLQSGGFTLRKWVSNFPEAIQNVPEELRSKSSSVTIEEDNSLKVLGIKWNARQDTIQINTCSPCECQSKRQLLSFIARTFDPIGLLSPSTIVLKILLQDLWRDELSWDDPLPPSVIQTWVQFSSEIDFFSKIHIECCLQSTSELASDYQLHGFADASQRAYAAVVYLRTVLVSGEIKTNIIAAKTHVSPVKSITLPRLELCATVLLSELCSNILSVLPIPISSVHLYTDSQIVLCWIRTEPSKLSTFVSHRISQIQNSDSHAIWSHVRSHENPADVASRGILPQALSTHSLWWSGPPWLRDITEFPRGSPTSAELSESDQQGFQKELKSKVTVSCSSQANEPLTILSSCSSFSRLIRIIAFCVRFCYNASHPTQKQSGVLTAVELKKSLCLIVRCIQTHYFHSEIKLLSQGSQLPPNSKINSLSPFLDAENLLRVGGRLSGSNLKYDAKHQFLLPNSHPIITTIIIYYHKLSLHAGTSVVLTLLRQQFWVPAARSEEQGSSSVAQVHSVCKAQCTHFFTSDGRLTQGPCNSISTICQGRGGFCGASNHQTQSAPFKDKA